MVCLPPIPPPVCFSLEATTVSTKRQPLPLRLDRRMSLSYTIDGLDDQYEIFVTTATYFGHHLTFNDLRARLIMYEARVLNLRESSSLTHSFHQALVTSTAFARSSRNVAHSSNPSTGHSANTSCDPNSNWRGNHSNRGCGVQGAQQQQRWSWGTASVFNFRWIGFFCFRAAFGQKYSEDKFSNFMSLFNKMLELLGAFAVGDFIPWLGWIDKLNEDKEKELVDVLLEVQRDSTIDFPLEGESIKGVILDMFAGGIGTTSAAAEWAMSELLRHPRALKKLQGELRTITHPKAGLSEPNLIIMEYLKAVIKGTLRLYPPGPLLLFREASQDVKINGYDIPAKTQVITNAWAIQRDPSSWAEPTNLVYAFDWALPGGAKSETLDMTETTGVALYRRHPLLLQPLTFVKYRSVVILKG
ncbi:hypothetical protein Cgig2_033184 [Carnegiea gigantea]|uniref:Cytochrome P450 n=1 Tax=Carnegiea gigantea TaxID=171969 RepID=A0A9Q1JUX6_9CARY|nr:hypothetical protein Cgig2_033184 [Carnegiea gigantea]